MSHDQCTLAVFEVLEWHLFLSTELSSRGYTAKLERPAKTQMFVELTGLDLMLPPLESFTMTLNLDLWVSPSPWDWPWPLGVLQPIRRSFVTSPKGECPFPLGDALHCATVGESADQASRDTFPYLKWSWGRPLPYWSRSTAPRGWPPCLPRWLCPPQTVLSYRVTKGTMMRSWYDDSCPVFHGGESKLRVVLGKRWLRFQLSAQRQFSAKGHNIARRRFGREFRWWKKNEVCDEGSAFWSLKVS